MNLARFKLNRNTYADLLAAQNGVCKICHGGQWGDGNKFAIDHDHNCCAGDKSCGGCIRGLLCNACNSALGMMNDDATRLHSAADYLERYRRGE
jgi:hypothetical protein